MVLWCCVSLGGVIYSAVCLCLCVRQSVVLWCCVSLGRVVYSAVCLCLCVRQSVVLWCCVSLGGVVYSAVCLCLCVRQSVVLWCCVSLGGVVYLAVCLCLYVRQSVVRKLKLRLDQLQRETSAIQAEQARTLLTRSHLETLCRELQAQNRAIKVRPSRKNHTTVAKFGELGGQEDVKTLFQPIIYNCMALKGKSQLYIIRQNCLN